MNREFKSFLLNYKWLVFSVLVLLNFWLLYRIGHINFDFFFGIRDTFFYSQDSLLDLSLYSVRGAVVYLFDSGLFGYFWIYFILNFFPWSSVPFVAFLFSCLLTLINIALALFVSKSKWSFVLVPLAFLLMPTFEFPNIFAITFFLLALKFRSKPYLCAFFSSFAFFFKQYMIIPHLLLIISPYIRKKPSKTLFFQLLIFLGIPLVVYTPFDLFAVFTNFLSTTNSGYDYNQFVTSFLFPSLVFIAVIAFRFFKSRSSDLLLILVSVSFILFAQSKFGACYYLGIFSVFFIMLFNEKSLNLFDKKFLFVFALLFFVSFNDVHYSLLLPSMERVGVIVRESMSFFNDKDMLSVNMLTVHPLWFSHDFAYNGLTLYNESLNVSNFDGAFFHKNLGFSGVLSESYNKSNCIVIPLFWASCVNCQQFMPVCFNSGDDTSIAYSWFRAHYASYADEICVISPLAYGFLATFSSFKKTFSSPCYADNLIEWFVIIVFKQYGTFIFIKNLICVFLIGIYLFKGFNIKKLF